MTVSTCAPTRPRTEDRTPTTNGSSFQLEMGLAEACDVPVKRRGRGALKPDSAAVVAVPAMCFSLTRFAMRRLR